MTTFWKHASAEQRLAQIDGAILLGLTAGQVGMNCGTTAGAIKSFAYYHGRRFGVGDGARRKLAMNGKKSGGANIKIAKHVNYRKAVDRFGWEQANSVDAKIFDDEHDSGNLFDPAPYDNEAFA